MIKKSLCKCAVAKKMANLRIFNLFGQADVNFFEKNE